MSRQKLIILPIYFQVLDKRRSYRSYRLSVVRTIITPQLCSARVMTRKLDHTHTEANGLTLNPQFSAKSNKTMGK